MDILFCILQCRDDVGVFDEPGIASLVAIAKHEGISVNVKSFLLKEIDDAYDYIIENKPDMLAFTTYDYSFEFIIKFIEKVKDQLPGIKACLGGYSASYNYQYIMEQYGFIDYIIVGEAEISFIELIRCIENGNKNFHTIKGLCYRSNNEIRFNEGCSAIKDLDSLPFSDRTLLTSRNFNMANMTTTRGCTHHCTFCCSNDYWGNNKKNGMGFRAMTPKRVVDEIEHIVKTYNKFRFVFSNNSFEDPNNNTESQLEIINEIMSRGLKIYFSVNYRVPFYKHATKDFMEKMTEAGLCAIFLGVESGNDFDLRIYNKGFTAQDAKLAVKYFSSFDALYLEPGFINFNPYTTLSALHKNNEFLYELGINYNVLHFASKLIPYKGTTIYNRLEKENLIVIKDCIQDIDIKFINSEIEAIFRYFNNLITENKELRKHCFLCKEIPLMIAFLKRFAKNNSDDNALKIISNTDKQIKEIMSTLNSQNSEWFNEMLQYNYAINNPTSVTKKYLVDTNAISLYSQMVALRSKLYKDLYKYDPKYMNIF